jgi:peptidoglycan/xylan/chitin deacetylase (PgdA/CDA1 family)
MFNPTVTVPIKWSGRTETWLNRALSRSPVQPLFRWRAQSCLSVLAYHGIHNPQRFEQHLDYLVKYMHPVSLNEVVEAMNNRYILPKHAVLVTFDDGERSIYEVGLPMLRERAIPAAVFVVAGLLDTETPLWWTEVELLLRNGGIIPEYSQLPLHKIIRILKQVDDIKRLEVIEKLRQTAISPLGCIPQLRRHELATLESAGISVGNHTLTHPCLNRCSNEKIVHEIYQAHDRLTSDLGHAPCAFAYPNGDADNRASKVLADLGYSLAFLFDHRHSPINPVDRYRISRLRVDSDTPLDRFRIILSGLHPAIHHALGRV